MGIGSLPPRAVHQKSSSGLAAIHGVLSSWQEYRSSLKASAAHYRTATGSTTAPSASLTLDGFQVDREEACVVYLSEQCEVIGAEQRPTRLHVHFQPYSLARGDEHLPAGFISQWLADEENGIRRNLESLVIHTEPAPSTSFGSEWITEAWAASMFPILEIFGNQPHSLKQFKIHGSLFDTTSTRDVLVNHFGQLVRKVLLQACSPSNNILQQETPTWPLSSSSLTHISFMNIHLTPFVANQIAQGLRGQRGLVTASGIHAHLELLALVDCHIDDERLDDLLSSLLDDYSRKLPRLRELLLGSNCFSSATFSTIFSHVLPLVPNLTVLNLSDNRHFFVSPMAQSKETNIDEDDGSLSSHSNDSSEPTDLADQRWEEQYVTDFANALQNHKKLHTISLRSMVPHYPSTTIPVLIAHFFSTKQSSLTLLSLGDFRLTKQCTSQHTGVIEKQQYDNSIHLHAREALRYDIMGADTCHFGIVGKPRRTSFANSDPLMASFLRGFSFIERVDMLSMKWCGLTRNDTAEELTEFLSSRQEQLDLKRLILCNCVVNEAVGRRFEAARSLETLYFEMCYLDDSVTNAILEGNPAANAVEDDKASGKLKKLGFPVNQLRTSSLPQLTLALKRHKELEELDLSRNAELFADSHLSLSTTKEFFRALSEHSNLKKLRLCLRGMRRRGEGSTSKMNILLFFQYMSQNKMLQELDMRDTFDTFPFKIEVEWADNLASMSSLSTLRFDHRLQNNEANMSVLARAIAPYTSLLECSFHGATWTAYRGNDCDPRIERILQRNRYLFRLTQDFSNEPSSSFINKSELAPLVLQRLGSNQGEGSAVFLYLKQATASSLPFT